MKRSRANDDAEINNLSKHFKSTLTLTLGNSLAPSTQAEIMPLKLEFTPLEQSYVKAKKLATSLWNI